MTVANRVIADEKSAKLIGVASEKLGLDVSDTKAFIDLIILILFECSKQKVRSYILFYFK